jgi:integrase
MAAPGQCCLHCLRHSFIFTCASNGIDERLIDEWSGHSTEEQRRRCCHLNPNIQADALPSVFGLELKYSSGCVA